MSSLLDKASGVAKGARTAADLATWAGRWGKRQITANSRGLCLVCNNLQPHGHERTLARKALAPTAAGTTTAMLELSDISTAKLLETREIDPKTGLPKRQCRYCRLLCDIFDQFFIDEWMSWITETHNKMNISVGLMICEGKPLIINCWAFTYDKWILHPRVDLEVYMDQHLQQPGGTLTGPSAATGALPTMGPVAPRAESVSSESCFRFMRDCVSQCLGEHPKCRTQDTGFVPTRLLYLGQDNRDLRIRIGVPPEERIQWAALSHCWGGGTPIKLLQANLTQLTEHVNISDLPATFSNAIDIARFLGLRYLWIDSICIIQDDTHDWDVEASRMGFVYSQAFLVICGASSPNPSTPFLGPREPDWLPKQFD
ncbi:heterokaryon incompatibility protein-domain-containing protein, partial [Bombardia bombarda]